MKRLIVAATTSVMLAVGLAAASVANADPANDREFIQATDRVISDLDGNWVGYPDVPAQTRIDVANVTCEMLDAGTRSGAINDFIAAALGPREYPGYLAA